jgi:hypothetical protein
VRLDHLAWCGIGKNIKNFEITVNLC